jgi:hypothetical protein
MFTEKIKIVRREFYDEVWKTRYDVYVGFTGIPSTWPFITKWVLDMSNLTYQELVNYIKPNLVTRGKTKIIVK